MNRIDFNVPLPRMHLANSDATTPVMAAGVSHHRGKIEIVAAPRLNPGGCVAWRTDGDIRVLHYRASVVCPTCGSDRLIPLTFVPALGTDRAELPKRPVAKCAACGERTYVSVRIHRSLSRD